MKKLYAKPKEKGKFITIYSKNPEQAHEIAMALFSSDWVKGFTPAGPGQRYSRDTADAIASDVRIAGLDNADCRYGAYIGNLIPGPDPGTIVSDSRACGWPPWLGGWGEMMRKGVTEYSPAGQALTLMSWEQALAHDASKGPARNRTLIPISGR